MKRIALIGFGEWGLNLARVLYGLGHLYYICDLDSKKLKLANEQYRSVKTLRNIKEGVNDIDAVVIATPAGTHYAIAKEMLSLSKDIFVEKPLALSVSEGKELVKLAKAKKKILMVGHILQYHPAILKIKDMIQSNEIGKIRYIYSNRLNIGKFRREENILWSFAPHDISAILFLVGRLPDHVCSSGGEYLHRGIADITVSNLSFKEGVKAHIFVSWLHPFKEQKLIVVGDKKMVVFDDIVSEGKLTYYNHKIDLLCGNYTILFKDRANIVDFKMSEPLKNECEEFIRCIENRVQPKTDGIEGVEVLRIIEACQKSLANEGPPVKV